MSKRTGGTQLEQSRSKQQRTSPGRVVFSRWATLALDCLSIVLSFLDNSDRAAYLCSHKIPRSLHLEWCTSSFDAPSHGKVVQMCYGKSLLVGPLHASLVVLQLGTFDGSGLVLPPNLLQLTLVHYNQPGLVLPAGLTHLHLDKYDQADLRLPGSLVSLSLH
jgi:hypothetical protein